jgi:K+:H+ antiporter
MELVIATIGLSIGVLTTEGYAMLVLIAVSTTLMTAPLLRVVVQRMLLDTDAKPGSTAADVQAADVQAADVQAADH